MKTYAVVAGLIAAVAAVPAPAVSQMKIERPNSILILKYSLKTPPRRPLLRGRQPPQLLPPLLLPSVSIATINPHLSTALLSLQ